MPWFPASRDPPAICKDRPLGVHVSSLPQTRLAERLDTNRMRASSSSCFGLEIVVVDQGRSLLDLDRDKRRFYSFSASNDSECNDDMAESAFFV